MSNVWNPEIVMTSDLATSLIKSQFPHIRIQTIEEIGEGFDNTIFLVDNMYIFRFPRREIAVHLLKSECIVLPKLVKILPISISEPLFYGKKSKEYPWIFIGYKYIKGSVPQHLTTTNREKMIRPLADFLKSLHQVPTEGLVQVGFPYDELERLDIRKRKPRLLENIKKLKEQEDDALFQQVEKYALTLKPTLIPDKKVITHGDLHIRNLIVNGHNELTGIIDWGDTHIGHPAIDLSIIYSIVPAKRREEFFSIYGEVDQTTLTLAKFKAVYTLVFLLNYSLDKKDKFLYEEGKKCLTIALSK
jgi:aminoglycoside phosphotransferase (APT) family kinase protein